MHKFIYFPYSSSSSDQLVNLFFPCSPKATISGVANFSLVFNTTGSLSSVVLKAKHVLGLFITFTGRKICNCTTCTSGTTSLNDDENILKSNVFYVVAIIVVAIIVVVIGVTVTCHCFMVHPLSRKKNEEEIE